MMDRRDFIKKIGGATAILTVVPGAIIASSAPVGMARPIPVSKVGNLVSRETISSVERSVIQGQWIDLNLLPDSTSLEEILRMYKETGILLTDSNRERTNLNKMQIYEPKSFF